MPKLTIDNLGDDFWNFTNETIDQMEEGYKEGVFTLKQLMQTKYQQWMMDKFENWRKK